MGTHDEQKLRRFLAARRSGDAAAARRWWDELLTDNFDRVRTMVILQARGHLSHEEQQDALQRALIRIAVNMIHTFRGTSMGEWVEATRTLVAYACMDTQRRAMATSGRERSLDWSAGAEDEPRQPEAEVFAAIEARAREEERRDHDAEALSEGRAFLAWALPQLSGRRREVIELDRMGVPVEEIQRRLGVSRDVVYAARSRALRDLAKLRERYTP